MADLLDEIDARNAAEGPEGERYAMQVDPQFVVRGPSTSRATRVVLWSCLLILPTVATPLQVGTSFVWAAKKRNRGRKGGRGKQPQPRAKIINKLDPFAAGLVKRTVPFFADNNFGAEVESMEWQFDTRPPTLKRVAGTDWVFQIVTSVARSFGDRPKIYPREKPHTILADSTFNRATSKTFAYLGKVIQRAPHPKPAEKRIEAYCEAFSWDMPGEEVTNRLMSEQGVAAIQLSHSLVRYRRGGFFRRRSEKGLALAEETNAAIREAVTDAAPALRSGLMAVVEATTLLGGTTSGVAQRREAQWEKVEPRLDGDVREFAERVIEAEASVREDMLETVEELAGADVRGTLRAVDRFVSGPEPLFPESFWQAFSQQADGAIRAMKSERNAYQRMARQKRSED